MIAPTVSGVAPSVERHSAALRCGPSSPARRAIRRAQVKKARRIHKTPFVSFPLFPFFLFLSPPSAFSAHSRTLRVSGPAVRIFFRSPDFVDFHLRRHQRFFWLWTNEEPWDPSFGNFGGFREVRASFAILLNSST